MRPAGPEETHRLVGRVGRPHGVHGEVGVAVRTDVPEERFTVGAHLADGAQLAPGCVHDEQALELVVVELVGVLDGREGAHVDGEQCTA